MVRHSSLGAIERRLIFFRFPTHAFVVLTLQKLVQLCDSDDSDDDSYDSDNDTTDGSDRRGQRSGGVYRRLQRLFGKRKSDILDVGSENGKPNLSSDPRAQLRGQPTGFSDVPGLSQLRTLQMYHAAPNDPRTLFMQKHSALSCKKLAVACEQVSMFITQDNTIISFFELSAEDVEAPIIRRLQTNDTIIRQYVIPL